MKKIFILIIMLLVNLNFDFVFADTLVSSLNTNRYISKDHPKALGLNIQVDFPDGFISRESENPSVVQEFVNPNLQGIICLLMVNNAKEKSLSQDEWDKSMKDVMKGMKDTFDSNPNVNLIDMKKIYYSGIIGVLSNLMLHQNSNNVDAYSEVMNHTLFYENKLVIMQCQVNSATFKEAQDLYKNKYENIFYKIGNDITILNK